MVRRNLPDSAFQSRIFESPDGEASSCPLGDHAMRPTGAA
jgi:hypothetical protein